MRAYDIILKKRNGEVLEKEELEYMINGCVNGTIPDYQTAAFLMAVYFKHLTRQETYYLTEIMRYSGDTIDLSQISGITVDKHSTGGVGDKTTLVLGPMVAACGAKVAKLSGRGLGHTGGTIDKLESIPGFKTNIDMTRWIEQVNTIGFAIAGQTANLVPGDKKIYALRDVTATVDEPSLIASSIMSKKLAGGADAFVLDVKVGSGAFMPDVDSAKELAKIMVDIAKKAGKEAVAILTNMDEPLGNKIGNALEVIEAVDTLKGNGPDDFTNLCITLGKYMLKMALSMDLKEAEKRLEESISSGKAYEKFLEFVQAQNGDIDYVVNPTRMLTNDGVYEMKAEQDSYLCKINTQKVGIAANLLGAGRESKDDKIDYSVGFDFLKKPGDLLKKDDKIVKIYYNDEIRLEESISTLKKAIRCGKKENVEKNQLIFDIIG
ncbi:MAG: pyrimidine-nucleoside phosphorylase [Thermotogaceae bacterium]|jgi:pyrimidine-nucleoside phosphorylase|nr:pyrimidine-nucleoside phosphorylase [Thermotogaceae bacterium]